MDTTVDDENIISVHVRWFRMYVTVTFRSMSRCYVGQVLDEGLIKLPGVLTERYEACEELE